MVELEAKKGRGELNGSEEIGEYLALSMYPGHLEGQRLEVKKFLSERGLAEWSPEEDRRRLQIFAETHPDYEPSIKSSEDRREQKEGRGDGDVEQGETSAATLDVLHQQAIIAGLEHPEWDSGDPKAVIGAMTDAMPDNVPVYTMDTLHLMPKNEPTPLELYLLSKLSNLPKLTTGRTEGALSVMDSIGSLRDQVRTKKFLLGIRDTIRNLDSSGGGTINVCDAGCGALPILAIYAALCSDKVRCTALELNPNSAEIAREVVKSLGLSDRIQIVETDAIKFQPDAPFDFLVSETIHSGLTQEPIVQILGNLQRHVRKDGVTIPSGVKIKAALVKKEDFIKPKGFVKIGKNMHHVVDPEWQEVATYTPGDRMEEIDFTLPTTGIPQGNYMVVITSTVDVGSQHLDTYQSLISMPQYVHDGKGNLQFFALTGDQNGISVKYKPGDRLNGVGKII